MLIYETAERFGCQLLLEAKMSENDLVGRLRQRPRKLKNTRATLFQTAKSDLRTRQVYFILIVRRTRWQMRENEWLRFKVYWEPQCSTELNCDTISKPT